MRYVAVAVAVLVGTGSGVAVTSAVRDDRPRSSRPPASSSTTVTAAAPGGGVLLAWVPGGLPAGFAARVADSAVDEVTVVLGDTVQLVRSVDASGTVVDEPGGSRTIPLDAIAVDCASWAPLAPIADAAVVCALEDDEVVLGTTSARLRRLGSGAALVLANGRTVRVAGVVDDTAVGAAEGSVLPATGASAAGVATERYALIGFAGDRADAEREVRATTPGAMRVRGPGETPWLRHGDAVLPASLIKEVFGEFAAAARGGGDLDVDPAWAARSLITTELPLLGQARCHVALVDALRGALAELEARRLLDSLDRGTAGCWNPRTIAGSEQPSRHAWGAAVDLVPLPRDADVLDEVVAVMERWGFTWGGHWVSPDPVHFEYLRPPTRSRSAP